MSVMAVVADFGGPITKYFSFVALGLMLTIGYLLFRLGGDRKRREGARADDLLRESLAEAEQRRRAGVDALAPSEAQAAENERLRRLSARHDPSSAGGGESEGTKKT